jgi:hypothetical protein
MGYGLSVFRVPREALDRACGKSDRRLLDEAMTALREGLAAYDEQMDAPSSDYDIDLSHGDALREIFTGEYTEGVPGARYGWALEVLCGFLGELLDNRHFVPCDMAWYTTLDETLAHHRVPLKFADLIYRSPVPIPEPDDWPCVGHWTDEDFAAADRLEAILPQIDDPNIKDALASALGWLEAARECPGSLIVGFHG